ncbi:MAG: DUF4040 domain-containing protein [Gammaproteobacteria bacterium]
MSTLINILVLTLMGITAISAIRMKNLFAAVMLTGIYSLLSAFWFLILDAADVSFTEAAVGAGFSTVLMLGTLALTHSSEGESRHNPLLPLSVVLITGAVLVYGTLDVPAFGDANAPIHTHVAPHYIEKSGEEIGVPNIVTSVLASYRGFDTLGETTVIFTAGVAILMLLGIGRRRERDDE